MLATLLLLIPAIPFAETRAEETDIVYPEDVGGEPGDVVMLYSPWWLRLHGENWTHAAIYIGNYTKEGNNGTHKVVEATFHSENWGWKKRIRYKLIAAISVCVARKKFHGEDPALLKRILKKQEKEFLSKIQNYSYSGNITWGRVEVNDLYTDLVEVKGEGLQVTRVYTHAYGKVNLSKALQQNISDRDKERLRRAVISYGVNKSMPIWPLVGYTEMRDRKEWEWGARPFDFVSPWSNDSKQMDEFTIQQVNSTPSLAMTLDYGYYCSELVWAAWMHASKTILGPDKPIDLDGNDTTGAVLPWDLWESEYIDWYHYYEGNSSFNISIDVNDTLNATLYYPDEIINVTGIYDVIEINGSYHIVTLDNKTYPLDTLTDLEFITASSESNSESSESSSAENGTANNETANSEESSSEENSSNDNSNSEDNSSNDQSNSEDNSDSNQDSSNEDDNSSSDDDDQSNDTATGEQSSSEQSQNG